MTCIKSCLTSQWLTYLKSLSYKPVKKISLFICILSWQYTPERGTFLAIFHILSACLWGLKAGWLRGFGFFQCIVCTIFNVYFGKFVMTCIDIGEIGCMSIPQCLWIVIVVNLVKQTWFFCMMQPIGVVLCIPCQYRVSLPMAAIIATRHRGMRAARRCRRSTGISAHSSSRSWGSSPRFWGGLSILVIAWPNSSQICYKVLQSGDLAGCPILVTLPSWRKSRTNRGRWAVALSPLVSSRYARCAARQMALRCFAKCPCRAHWWCTCICRGAKEAFWHHC